MKYEKARAEVVLFDNSDVITATGDGRPCYIGHGDRCDGPGWVFNLLSEGGDEF